MNKRKRLKIIIICILAAGVMTAGILSLFLSSERKQPEPKYVFLFIGDGMGSGVTVAAEALLDRRLTFREFPVIGIMTTDNVYGEVTDSAAAITAMVCGQKTKNGRIGMDRKGNQEWLTASELMAQDGRAVGVLSTACLNHATPAGFYGKVLDREEVDTLADQAVRSTFLDVLGGGGFALEETGMEELLKEAGDLGWRIVKNPEEADSRKDSGGPLLLMREGFYSAPFMEYEIDRRRMERHGETTWSLADMTEKAIGLLGKKDCFFLAVESALVDTALHQGDLAGAAYEVAALDDAVSAAARFYRRHPEDTLILVLADHETGGVTLPVGYDLDIYEKQRASWCRINGYLRELLEENGTDREFLDMLDYELGLGSSGAELEEKEEEELLALYRGGERKKIRDAVFGLLQEKAGVSFSTAGHTASPVTVYALGKGQERFAGCFDNTDIFQKLTEW